MSGDLSTWALPRLQRLLPLDDASLKDVIAYSSTLSKDAAAEHLKDLLGDAPPALEFISSFNSRRATTPPSASVPDDAGVPKPQKKGAKKTKAPLHASGPARRPEGYGDVVGGYTKHYDTDDGFGPSSRPASRDKDVPFLSSTPDALQVPRASTGGLNPGSSTASRDVSPAKGSQKLPPSAHGNLISDFGFANVRSKQSKKPAHGNLSQPQSGTSTPRKGGAATTTTSSVNDLTAAIAALELSTNPSLSKERRICPCNASIHPLFATAPNCLNCGKIICALEGLQPCSFCDSPILTKDQVNGMIKALKEERGVEKMAVHNVGQSQSGRGTPVLGGSTPDSSGDETSSAAARARAHRDKLLSFQRENAQRTRVHDEAADYDATLTPGTTQWMSPVQRAAALKKQQKYMRELEEANRPEWEKKRTVMSMSIKGGKLVKTYGQEKAPPLMVEQADQEEEEVEDRHLNLGAENKGGAFSNNPLLAGGRLVRPIWKATEGATAVEDKGKDREPERKSVWRRVQDENDDNEQWILDGGLRGYGTESRTMEDGSQAEG